MCVSLKQVRSDNLGDLIAFSVRYFFGTLRNDKTNDNHAKRNNNIQSYLIFD